MTNSPIHLTAASLSFIEALRVLLFQANAIEVHARQAGTFGKVADAITTALAEAIAEATDMGVADRHCAAKAIYSAMIDCGEDTAYCIHLWNINTIDRYFSI